MATTPAKTIPATSSGQTAAALAEPTGVSQAEVMAEQAKYPDLNPDVVIGNILANRAKQSASATPTVASPTIITSDKAEAADKEATTWLQEQQKAQEAINVGKNPYAQGSPEFAAGETQFGSKPVSAASPTAGASDGKGKVVFPDGSYQNEGAVGDQYMRWNAQGQSLGYGTYKPPETAPTTAAETAQAAAQSASEKEYNDYIAALDARRVALSDANKAAIDDIKATYERIKEEQRSLNEGLLGSLTQAGIRSGRSKYAPEMEAFRISEEQNRGLKRLEALDRQALTLIREAESAAAEKDFELLSGRYNAWKENEKEKRDTITQMHQMAMDEERLALDRAKEKRDAAKFEFDVMQELERPAREAAAETRQTILGLAEEFPDAGITEEDSLLTAQNKVKNSDSWKAKKQQELTANQQDYEVYKADEVAAGRKPMSFIDFVDRNVADGKAPVTRDIDGTTKQWNPVTNEWEDPTGVTASTPAMSTTEVAKTKEAEQLAGIVELNAALDGYYALIKEHGTASVFTAGARQKLDSAKERINLAIKNAEGLGALQAPDIELVQRMIPDVTREGFWDTSKGLFYDQSLLGIVSGGVAQRALKTIDQVKDSYKEKSRAKLDQLLAKGASPDDPLVATLAEQLGIDLANEEKSYDFSTPEGVDAFLDSVGKTDVGSDTRNAQAGSLSQKYESGGDPGAIGYDSTGGYSYGKYQLAHQNAKRFIDESSYAKEFKGLTFNSPEWRSKWKEVAKKDPEGFGSAQQQYIEKTHVEPQLKRLAKAGLSEERLTPTLREVIHSTAVQHGANTDVVEKAFKKVGPNASEEELIKAIYDERWGGGKRFASSTPAVRKAVYNRFFGPQGELNTALSRLG